MIREPLAAIGTDTALVRRAAWPSTGASSVRSTGRSTSGASTACAWTGAARERYAGGGAFLVTQGGYEESANLTMDTLFVGTAFAGSSSRRRR